MANETLDSRETTSTRASLTRWRLAAICEALDARLAGEMDVETIDRDHYVAARNWAEQELARRSTRAIRAKSSTRKEP